MVIPKPPKVVEPDFLLAAFYPINDLVEAGRMLVCNLLLGDVLRHSDGRTRMRGKRTMRPAAAGRPRGSTPAASFAYERRREPGSRFLPAAAEAAPVPAATPVGRAAVSSGSKVRGADRGVCP
jgi:hypothetical protein